MPFQVTLKDKDTENQINKILREVDKRFNASKSLDISKNDLANNDQASKEQQLKIYKDKDDKVKLVLKYQGKNLTVPLSNSTSSKVNVLTNSSGGTASTTIAAVSGSGADTAINNNFATLTTELEALKTALKKLNLAR